MEPKATHGHPSYAQGFLPLGKPPFATFSQNRGNLAMKPQGCVAFLQYTRVSLKSLIPKSYDFEPITVGVSGSKPHQG